jgi:hypothetical protein
VAERCGKKKQKCSSKGFLSFSEYTLESNQVIVLIKKYVEVSAVVL